MGKQLSIRIIPGFFPFPIRNRFCQYRSVCRINGASGIFLHQQLLSGIVTIIKEFLTIHLGIPGDIPDHSQKQKGRQVTHPQNSLLHLFFHQWFPVFFLFTPSGTYQYTLYHEKGQNGCQYRASTITYQGQCYPCQGNTFRPATNGEKSLKQIADS